MAKADKRQGKRGAFGAGRRGNAERKGQSVKDLRDMRHDLKVTLKGGQKAGAVLIFKLGRQIKAEIAADRGHDSGVAAAKKMAGDIGQIDMDPHLRQLVHQHPGRDDLAVDQHAVTIKDDQLLHFSPAESTHRRSNRMLAPTRAVLPEGAKGGQTSTTAAPI